MTGAQIGGMHSEDGEEATSQGRNQKEGRKPKEGISFQKEPASVSFTLTLAQ